MEEDILEIIQKIKSMDLEFFNGQMDVNMKDIGKMVNNMEKEYILDLTELREKENGKKEKESDG
jgi:hypothetical protein